MNGWGWTLPESFLCALSSCHRWSCCSALPTAPSKHPSPSETGSLSSSGDATTLSTMGTHALSSAAPWSHHRSTPCSKRVIKCRPLLRRSTAILTNTNKLCSLCLLPLANVRLQVVCSVFTYKWCLAEARSATALRHIHTSFPLNTAKNLAIQLTLPVTEVLLTSVRREKSYIKD